MLKYFNISHTYLPLRSFLPCLKLFDLNIFFLNTHKEKKRNGQNKKHFLNIFVFSFQLFL